MSRARAVGALGFALPLAVALLVRAIALGAVPLWLDEANTVLIAWHDPYGVVSALSRDGNPPLFYWILHAWMAAFGSSEAAVRSLAALFGTLSVAALYGAARLLFPERRRVAPLAASLAAIGPLHIYYSRECRMYSLTPLVGVLLLVALHRALDTGRPRYWVLHSILLAAGLYTHNYFLFLVPLGPLAALLSSGQRAAFPRALASAAAAAAVYAPWVPMLLWQTGSGVSTWIPRLWEATPPAAALLRSLEVMGVGDTFPFYLGALGLLRETLQVPAVWASLRVFGLVLGVGLLGAGVVAAFRCAAERAAATRIALLLVLPLVVPFAASFLVTPIYVVGRYEMIAFPAYALLAARGVAALLDARGRLPAVGLVLLWLGGATLCDVTYFRALARPELGDEKLVAEWLRDHGRAGDAVILPGYARGVPEYYFTRWGTVLERLSFPPEVAEHPGWFDYERAVREARTTRHEAALLAAEWRRVPAGGHVLFLIVTRDTPPPVVDALKDALEKELGPPRLAYRQEPLRSFYVLAFGT